MALLAVSLRDVAEYRDHGRVAHATGRAGFWTLLWRWISLALGARVLRGWDDGWLCHEPTTMKLTRDEFEQMALEHVDMLYRIARRLTRDPSAADDLVQETYLRALRSYESFDLKEFGIRPWLLRIMHNLHASKFKRDKRQPVGVDDEQLQQQPAGDGAVGMPPSTASPGLMWEGMDEQLVAAVESLPAEYQTVLLLWAIDELSYKEIAQAVDVPIGTVMSRLFRARQKLSEQLQDFATKEGILRPD